MKNTLIALIFTAGLSSSALLAMREDGESQKEKPKPASFTVTPEFQPGQPLYQRYITLGAHDHDRLEQQYNDLSEHPNHIPPCDDDDLLASSSLNTLCIREAFHALEKALGPCEKSSLLSSQLISQEIGIGISRGAGAYVYPDLHEHFHNKAMTRGDLELFVFEQNGVCNSVSDQKIIHDLHASDLGQEKCVDTVRAAIEKDIQEDDVLVIHGHACTSTSNLIYPQPRIYVSDTGRAKLVSAMVERLKLSSSEKPKIEEVD